MNQDKNNLNNSFSTPEVHHNKQQDMRKRLNTSQGVRNKLCHTIHQKQQIGERCNPRKFNSSVRLGENKANYKTTYNSNAEWMKYRG